MVWSCVSRVYRFMLDSLPAQIALQVQFFREHGKFADLKHPKTFSEKVQCRKLFGSDPRFEPLCDKVKVKELIAERIGRRYVVPTVWHGISLPHERPKSWPESFVVKSNHTSGQNLFVRGHGVRWDQVKREADSWTRKPWPKHLHENWYNRIEKMILVEEFICGPDIAPIDYKFFVFHGKVHYIQVDTGRFTNHRRAFFDGSWNRQEFGLKYQIDTSAILPPRHLETMLSIAEELGNGFDFVRVDLYDTDAGPLFGELTFAPGSGYERFFPASYDKKFGELW